MLTIPPAVSVLSTTFGVKHHKSVGWNGEIYRVEDGGFVPANRGVPTTMFPVIKKRD